MKEPSATYFVRNREVPEFFGQQTTKGERFPVDDRVDDSSPRLFYSHPHGEIWLGDSIEWLRTLDPGSVDLVFADPPYNIKKAEWDTFESQQEYVAWSVRWIEQVARVLKPEGTFYVCGFSEILADLRLPAARFFKGCRWLVWHYKNKATRLHRSPTLEHNNQMRLAKLFSFLLLLPFVLCSCRTTNPLPPTDLSEPGWTLRQGQAIWKPTHDAPEIAGEILAATQADGRALVQFTKTPLPFVTAQKSREAWVIEFALMNRRYAGRGQPPERLIWFQLARHCSGAAPGKSWSWHDTENGGWSLKNNSTGEGLEGAFNP